MGPSVDDGPTCRVEDLVLSGDWAENWVMREPLDVVMLFFATTNTTGKRLSISTVSADVGDLGGFSLTSHMLQFYNAKVRFQKPRVAVCSGNA